jgi:hypothetical protein
MVFAELSTEAGGFPDPGGWLGAFRPLKPTGVMA